MMADNSASDMVDTQPKNDHSTKMKAKRRLKRWQKAVIFLLIAASVAFIYLQTDVIQGQAGNLNDLIADGDDWSLHTSQPEELFRQPKTAKLLGCLLNNTSWARLLGFSSSSRSNSGHFESAEEFVQTWLDGEVLITVKWPKTPGEKTESFAEIARDRPFDSITLVLRPAKGRAKALARLLMFPGISKPILRTLLDRDVGAENLGDIIQLANPDALQEGNPRRSSKIRGLAFTTVKDLIILGTSFDDVQAKRQMALDLKTESTPPAAGTLKATISPTGQDKLVRTWNDLFGDRTSSLLHSLRLGPQGKEKLHITAQVTDTIRLTTSWPGVVGKESELDNLAQVRNQAVFSGGAAAICRRIGDDLSRNFDAATVIRHAAHFLGNDGQMLPPLDSWLTKTMLHEIAQQLRLAQAKNLRLSWASPATAKSEDSPHLSLSVQVHDSDSWAKIVQAAGIPMKKRPGWQELQIPPTLGFTHYSRPQILLEGKHFHVANGPPLSTKRNAEPKIKTSPALWRFRTYGVALAHLLQALDLIRLEQLTHPTFARRRAVLKTIGKRQLTKTEIEAESQVIFQRHHEEAKDLLRTRGIAFQSLLKVLGDIRGEARSLDGRTVVTVTLN